MPGKKRQHAIRAADVPRAFDDACIEDLAKIGHLPAGTDRQRFADSVREAVRIYARDARKLTNAGVRDEIAALLSAAEQWQFTRAALLTRQLSSPEELRLLRERAERQFEHLASLIEKLSLGTCHLVATRAERLLVPMPDVRDPACRDQVCESVRRLCSFGGRYIMGRKRLSGKRSRTWEPLLYAPESIARPPKREAERQFVMNLELAWLEAVGDPPGLTARHGVLGPFARLVKECLDLAGASHADGVRLINGLDRRRHNMKSERRKR